ncbi:MAG: DUF2750 domain-containing protein [Halioglobus sp.]
MPFQLSNDQTQAVLKKDTAKRHSYFITKIVGWQQLWGAKKGDQWLVPKSPEKFEYFPLWPHPKCAQQALAVHFPGYEASEISLAELLEYWLPLFSHNNVQPAVFPNHEWAFSSVEASQLDQQLRKELAKYG